MNEMTSNHGEGDHDSDLQAIHEEYERVRGEFERLGFPARLQTALTDSGGNESWDMIEDVELEDFDFGPSSPPVSDTF